jgi:hypothetical protein
MRLLTLVSDNGRDQVLCKPVAEPASLPFTLTAAAVLLVAFLAGLVAGSLLQMLFSPSIEALPQGSNWRVNSVQLFKVVHRKPVPFLLHPEREDRANYLGVYCVETLECGHKVSTYPQADPLVAVRRECKKCNSNLVEFPKPRKEAA